MSSALATGKNIHSKLASDPKLVDLVNDFVAEIPQRISKMLLCADTHDWEGLRRLAHQIKGSSASYGFADVPPHAARLEKNIIDGVAEEIIIADLHDLVDLCGRLRGGPAK